MYEPRYSREFEKAIKKYASEKARLQKKIEFICQDPYHDTEKLAKGKWRDLRGKRSSHIGDFRVIFMICEECLKEDLKAYNLPDCGDCFDSPALLIFLTFGPHDIAYGKK
jgi:mRNA-degrading endonuclease RelE of RelBE toxin-antitoxin system